MKDEKGGSAPKGAEKGVQQEEVRKHPINCCVAAQGWIPAHLTKSGEAERVD